MRKYLIFMIIITVTATLAGCSFFKKSPIPPFVNSFNIDKGQVINSKKIKNGGNLLIVPFLAGPKVYATNDLQKAALHIVKGLSKTLQEQTDIFEILSGDEAKDADLILRGKIVKLTPSKKFWQIFRSKEQVLGIEGKLIDKKGGRSLLLFSHSLGSKEMGVSLNDLGSQMGAEIARYILNVLNVSQQDEGL